MEISISSFSTFKLIAVAGMLDAKSADGFNAVLAQQARGADTQLVIDMSGVGVATQAGLVGLLAAAFRIVGDGGQMRICGADRPIEKLIAELNHPDLLPCDPTLAASITAMSQRAETPVRPGKLDQIEWPADGDCSA